MMMTVQHSQQKLFSSNVFPAMQAAWLPLLVLAAVPAIGLAQAKPAQKKAPPAATAKPTTAAPAPAAKSDLPATVEAAERVLDLRTFPVMEGAKLGDMRTLGMLMCQVKAAPKAAFDFQRQQLLKRGFKELSGGYSDAQNVSGAFSKEGFNVRVSASDASYEPDKAGWSNVSVINDGNVRPQSLPVPPGVKPFHPTVYEASYLTDAKVADMAAACGKLLLAAGWQPYGQAGANEEDSSMQYFKRNAIKLQAWVSTAPAAEGKTLIRLTTELLQADLPAPPDVADPRYTDFQKTLRFDEPTEKTDTILEFYQERLPKLGWKATTERPVVDDRKKTQFVVYRNAKKELLSLDLQQFTGIVRVSLKHQTETELAEEERRFKAQVEREKQELARKSKKIKVAVPLPAKAGNVEQQQENILEFTLATGGGPAALTALRDHFRKEGWKEEEGTELDENTGRLELSKSEAQLSFSYFDTGLTDAEIRLTSTANVVLEPTRSKDKPPADSATAKPKGKAKTKPAVPGLPDLPPGVELPDDVRDLLKDALKE